MTITSWMTITTMRNRRGRAFSENGTMIITTMKKRKSLRNPGSWAGGSSKVVPMKRSMEVSMIKPTSIEDSKEICDYLLAGKAVVLNMEGLHTEVAQRIIDFTSGSTYSMNGNLQKISNYIFIATPESVELSGDFQDLLNGGSLDISGLNLRI